MTEKKNSIFKELSNVDVSEHTQQKMGLTYLSWAWAWSYLQGYDPNAKRTIKLYPEYDFNNHTLTGRKIPYLQTIAGCFVTVTVTIKGESKTESLPVMDRRNNAVRNPDVCQINNTRQRCFVKCLALFGLGIGLYESGNRPNNNGYQQRRYYRNNNRGYNRGYSNHSYKRGGYGYGSNTATSGQVNFINKLLKNKQLDNSSVVKWLTTHKGEISDISKSKASSAIDHLTKLDDKQKRA